MTSRFVFNPAFARAVQVRGLTLAELARRANVSGATAASAVRRRRPCNMATALRLARVVEDTPILPELERWMQAEEEPPDPRAPGGDDPEAAR